jgi:hypothetical protein
VPRTLGQQPQRHCQYWEQQAVAPVTSPQQLEQERAVLASPSYSHPPRDDPNKGVLTAHQEQTVSPYPHFGYRVAHPRYLPLNHHRGGIPKLRSVTHDGPFSFSVQSQRKPIENDRVRVANHLSDMTHQPNATVGDGLFRPWITGVG